MKYSKYNLEFFGLCKKCNVKKWALFLYP
jgi:hypothetical protein